MNSNMIKYQKLNEATESTKPKKPNKFNKFKENKESMICDRLEQPCQEAVSVL
jgi:hypothetical protein